MIEHPLSIYPKVVVLGLEVACFPNFLKYRCTNFLRGCASLHSHQQAIQESNTSLLIHKISTCRGLDALMILICEQHYSVGTVTHAASWEWQIGLSYTPYGHLNYPPPPWYVSAWGGTCWEPDSGFLAKYDKDRLHALPTSVLLGSAKSPKPTTLGSEPRTVSVFPGQLAKDNASWSYSTPWGENMINKFVVRADVWGWQFWDPILKLGQILERKPAVSLGRKGKKIKEI